MANTDDKLRTVRLQIIDEITGEPLEYVNVRTNAKSVSLSDGTFLEDVMKTIKTSLGNVMVSDAKVAQTLDQHLNSNLHVVPEKLANAFIDFQVTKNTGVITFTRYDGTTINWDSAMEHIPLDIDFDKKTNKLKLITDKNPEGVEVDFSALVDVFEGEVVDDTTTKVTSENHIIVHINKNGVVREHLSEELQTFVTTLEDFLDTYLDKIKGIEDEANNYSLPPATDKELGGIKTGFGLETDEEGVAHTTNVMIGNTITDATPCGMFLEICNIGGASTDPIPEMADATSYITSEGNIIEYVESSNLYTYYNYATTGQVEYNLPRTTIAARLVPGLELIKLSGITWYVCSEEPTREYAVLSAGDGFIYEQSAGAKTLVGYIDVKTFLNKFNNGELAEGRLGVGGES